MSTTIDRYGAALIYPLDDEVQNTIYHTLRERNSSVARYAHLEKPEIAAKGHPYDMSNHATLETTRRYMK